MFLPPFHWEDRSLGSAFPYTAWLVHNCSWLEFNTVEHFEMLKFVLSTFGNGSTSLNLMASHFSRNSQWAFLPWIRSLVLNPQSPHNCPQSDFLKCKAMYISFLKPFNISPSPRAMLIRSLPTSLLHTSHKIVSTLPSVPLLYSCKKTCFVLLILSGLFSLSLLHFITFPLG